MHRQGDRENDSVLRNRGMRKSIEKCSPTFVLSTFFRQMPGASPVEQQRVSTGYSKVWCAKSNLTCFKRLLWQDAMRLGLEQGSRLETWW